MVKRRRKNNPTAEGLHKILTYDKETGILHWKDKPNEAAGTPHKAASGSWYIQVRLIDKQYYAHMIIWCMVTGEWPTSDIDHHDHDGLNNRWNNLRLATQAQNCQNRPKNKNNTSGYKGVSWNTRFERWVACIGIDGKRKHLGYFNTAEEAYEAYCQAALELHKEFARVK